MKPCRKPPKQQYHSTQKPQSRKSNRKTLRGIVDLSMYFKQTDCEQVNSLLYYAHYLTRILLI